MLSVGIQFGRGFDSSTIRKGMVEEVPAFYQYDVIVVGSNPGGVAYAKEASRAGKKTALIKCINLSPAETEGVDENLEDMEEILTGVVIDKTSSQKTISVTSASVLRKDSLRMRTGSVSRRGSMRLRRGSRRASGRHGSMSWESTRRVRLSKLDLNNEFYKRGEQCRKLMHNAVLYGDIVGNSSNSGWGIMTSTPPVTLNWGKMSDDIMDFVMEENWKLATELSEESIEVFDGDVSFHDNHTVEVTHPTMGAKVLTTDFICLAPLSESILPEEIVGALEFGITTDDFLRLVEPPGTTLVVGGLPESLECAGIAVGAHCPVTIVTRTTPLKRYDSEIREMIISNLKGKGVKFLEGTNLKAIHKTFEDTILAIFEPISGSVGSKESENFTSLFKREYDTVLFAIGRKVRLNNLDLKNLGLPLDKAKEQLLISATTGETGVPNIHAVGGIIQDCPDGLEISQMAGTLLAKRLFHKETLLMDYSMIPTVMYTPVEYAYIGLSENLAFKRLGENCVKIYFGYFKPLDTVIPPNPKGTCFVKVITLKESDLLVGMHFYGPQAGEIIQGFAAAMKTGISMKDFQKAIGIAGTSAGEIFKLKEYNVKKDSS